MLRLATESRRQCSGNEVGVVGAHGPSGGGLHHCALSVTEGARQGAVRSQVFRESPRIDADDGRHVVLAQEPFERPDRTPV